MAYILRPTNQPPARSLTAGRLLPGLTLPFLLTLTACASLRSSDVSFLPPPVVSSLAVGPELTKDALRQLTTTAQTFTPETKDIYASAAVENLVGRHTLQWLWVTPDGQEYVKSQPLSIGEDGVRYAVTRLHHRITVAGEPAATFNGHWTVRLLLDGRLAKQAPFEIVEGGRARLALRVEAIGGAMVEDGAEEIIDGGRRVTLTVAVKNTGTGKAGARGVRIRLGGDSPLVHFLTGAFGSREHTFGAIAHGEEQAATFTAEMPPALPRSRGKIIVEAVSDNADVDAPVVRPVALRDSVDLAPSGAPGGDRPDAFALVIGVGRQEDAGIKPVEFASRDAQMVRDYLVKAAGFPDRQVTLLVNEEATLKRIKTALRDLANRSGPDSLVLIYYAGHGVPKPEGRSQAAAYLLPHDGEVEYLPDTALSVHDLTRLLEEFPTNQVVVLLDSCFAGAGQRSVAKSGTRPMGLVVENPLLASPKVSALVAARGQQVSHEDGVLKHGLFTYYLLRALRGEGQDTNQDGRIDLWEAFDYLRPRVERAARLKGGEQTPEVWPQASDTAGRGAPWLVQVTGKP